MNRVQYRLVALSVTPSWVVHDFFLHAIESRSDFKCDVEKKAATRLCSIEYLRELLGRVILHMITAMANDQFSAGMVNGEVDAKPGRWLCNTNMGCYVDLPTLILPLPQSHEFSVPLSHVSFGHRNVKTSLVLELHAAKWDAISKEHGMQHFCQ